MDIIMSSTFSLPLLDKGRLTIIIAPLSLSPPFPRQQINPRFDATIYFVHWKMIK